MLHIVNRSAPDGIQLGDLWQEAERLGRVTVDRDGYGDESAYRVQIRFVRRRGSTVWATGIDQVIERAMAKAITEARELG